MISNLTLIKILFLSDLPLIKVFLKKYYVNSIVNKLLLAGDEFMQEMHLKQTGFTYKNTKNKIL